MSRVDEALRRAAMSIATRVPTTERAIERRDRPALEQYAREDNATPRPAVSRDGSHERPAAAVGNVSEQLVVSPRFGGEYQGKLVGNGNAPPGSLEQYRRLAATLQHLQTEQALRRLMVSSAVPREGKTLTVVNLALTLSGACRRRVLLIDADLRRPSIHQVFGISNRSGLSDALRLEPSRLPLSRVSPTLSVLPAGSLEVEPMEALASDRMERLLDSVGSSFDWILLDAPPVGLMADAGLLARLTRAVIVVIGAGSTPYTLVERAIGELGREHIVGTVLNRIEEGTTPWSAYYSDYDSDIVRSRRVAPSAESE